MSDVRATFTDDAGAVRLEGVVSGDFAAPVTAREDLGGVPTTVANGASTALPFSGTSGPDTLLDRSAPTAPTVIVAGVYAFAVTVDPNDSLSAGGGYTVTLQLDQANDDAEVSGSAASTTAMPAPSCCVSGVWYFDAGDVVRVLVRNLDGVAALDYALTEAVVQRLS